MRDVRRVVRLDRRTRVLAVRGPGGAWDWLQRHPRFDRETAQALQESGISSVVLRRGFRRVSIPLSWLGLRPRATEPGLTDR